MHGDGSDSLITVSRYLPVAERRARMARRHRLAPGTSIDDVVPIAESLVVLHSTDPVTMYLSAAARMANPTLAAVANAPYVERSLIRHHAMRRTLWVGTPFVMRLAHAACTHALIGPEHRRTVTMLEDASLTTDGNAWLAEAKSDILRASARESWVSWCPSWNWRSPPPSASRTPARSPRTRG